MRFFISRALLASAGACLAATAVQAGPATTDRPYVGQTWIVACQKLPLHSRPSGYSSTRGALDYRTHVEILSLQGKYELPESQQDKNINNSESDSLMGGGDKEYFAWAEVAAQNGSGFVPLSCLVNGSLIDGPYENPADLVKQRFSLASESGAPEAAVSSRGFSKKEKGDKVAMRGMSAAGALQECSAEQIQANASAPDGAVSSRGFSKKERGDKVAMRGMSVASATVCIKEDYTGLEAAMAASVTVNDPYNVDMAFRREGGLGEFK